MHPNELLNLNICLSDIPQEARITGRTGKIYCNITVGARREPDQNGNDVNLWVSQTKEQKGQPKIYLGHGKTFVFQVQDSKPIGRSAGKSKPGGNIGF